MQPQPFGPPAGPPPGWSPPPAAPATNGNAVASLVVGVLSIVSCPILGVVGLVLGFRARRQIREANGAEGGDGLAVGGLITSALGIVVSGIVLVAILLVVAGRSTTGTIDRAPITRPTIPVPTTLVAPGEPDPEPGAVDGSGEPAEVEPPPAGATIAAPTPCPAADGSSDRTTTFGAAPPMCIDSAATYTATFETTEGTFTVALDAATMPSTTNNFVVLARYHYYDDTSIFRIDPSIDVFQSGAPATNSADDPGPGYTIDDEGGPFTYETGDLVMARTQQPNSTGGQYFVATGPAVSLLDSQGIYLNFGKVTEGLDVVESIAALYVPFAVSSPNASLGGGPSVPVVVRSITIAET
jgi:cyclophilin family peptidyl-prolyl cis-trans isomerase